jgi:hypothetical protein
MGGEAGSRKFNPSVAFGPQQITRYPKDTPSEALGHRYQRVARRNGKPLPLTKKIMPLLSRVHKAAVAEYEENFHKKFDQFNLGDSTEFASRLYHDNPKFKEACTLLQIGEAERTAITYPWANFLAADEVQHEPQKSGGLIAIAPRHFYETQALTKVDGSVKSISVSSVLKTSDGNYAIGLRGGHRWPNTFHVFASALLLTDGIKNGTQSISDFNLNGVLLPETGVSSKEIEKVVLLSRIADWTGTDPMYNFLVELNITMAQLESLFANHRGNSTYSQKTKYQSLTPIASNSFAIIQFLNTNYHGLLENRERADAERAILFPGAVALLSLAENVSIETLRGMHKDDNLH